MNRRVPYWDNFKLLLIFLVVFGHFLLPLSNNDERVITHVCNWIYLFHIPAFVFVSGRFSRSFIKNDKKEIKLTGFLCLYIFFTIALWIVDLVFNKTFHPKSLLSTSGAPWYLLSMFSWYLLMIYVSKLKFHISFPLSLGLGLLAGVYPECGSFLTLSRTIVFFPFFLLGFRFDDNVLKGVHLWHKILSLFVLISSAIIIFCYSDKMIPILNMRYADRSYINMAYSPFYGILFRLTWYIVVFVLLVCLICIIPSQHFRITYIGERTRSSNYERYYY